MLAPLIAGLALSVMAPGWLPAAVMTDSGGQLDFELGPSEQVTIVTDGSTYTLTSDDVFHTFGVADQMNDFDGFGTGTLTVESSGLTRYNLLVFTDAADDASLSFNDSGGSVYSDDLEVQFDGTGSSVTIAAAVTIDNSSGLDVEAEAIQIDADVDVSSDQRYRSPVTLGASVKLDSSSGNVRFDSTVDGGHGLEIDAGGQSILDGEVGGSDPPTALTIGSSGGTTTLGADVTTDGAQSYGDAVSTGATAIVLSATEIDFSGGMASVSGTGSLTLRPFDLSADVNLGQLTDAGAASLDLTFGDLTALADGFASITVSADAGSNATIQGAAFNDDISVIADDVFVGGIGALNSSVTLQALTGEITSSAGAVAFSAIVGDDATLLGHLAPGASPGRLTVESDLTLDAAGELRIEVTGTTPGTEHDQLRVLGPSRTVDLNGATLVVDGSGHVAALGEEIVLVELPNAASTVTGTFSGLAEGDEVPVGIYTYTISYAAGSGNDVALVGPLSISDYGDAPDTGAGTGPGNYNTLDADNGPAHAISDLLHLGATSDVDDDGLPTEAADGDDVDQALPIDEDGLAIAVVDTYMTSGTHPTLTLNVTNGSGSAANLYGWIDYDQDGEFELAERASLLVPDGTAGPVVLSFPSVPAGNAGMTYARFRLSTDAAAASPTGAASDGEVEDHRVEIVDPARGHVHDVLTIGRNINGGPSTLDLAHWFGYSVASLGDVDGDGIDDLAAGAPEHSGEPAPSSIYILLMNADNTVHTVRRLNSNQTTGSSPRFGISLAPLGDLDGDGVPDLVAGELRGTGAIRIIFLNSDGTEKSRVRRGSSESETGQSFGVAVANLGDLDGDGITDIAVGADALDTGGTNRGAVFIIFLRSDGSIKSRVQIAHNMNGGPSLANGDRFGGALAALGDIDGDGVTELAVGAWGDDTGGTNRGAVYILHLASDGTVQSSRKFQHGTANLPSLATNDRFGESLAFLGDLDGDGNVDLAAGVPDRDNGGVDRGAVFLLSLRADGSLDSTLILAHNTNGAPSLNSHKSLGQSLAYLGDRNGDGIPDLAVGAPESSDSGRGRVFLFFLNAAPVITQGDPVTVDMDEDGSPTPFSLTLDASDAEGDTLTWSIATGGQASNGTAGASGTGTSKAITYVPNPDFFGSDSFEVEAHDGLVADTITVDVNVAPTPDPPVITEGVSVMVGMDEDADPTPFSLTLNATDVDGDTLTWSVPAAGEPSDGTAGASGTGTSKAITYAPDADFFGSDSFDVEVTDGSLTDTITVNVTVAPINDAPVITEGASVMVTMDEDADPTAFSLTLNATDVEGDTLTWSIPAGGQASDGTAGASGTGASKAITYAPDADFNGSDSFDVEVSDGDKADTITVDVTIDPISDPPTITAPASIDVSVGLATALTGITFGDIDGNVPVQVFLTVGSGSLAATSGSGVTVFGPPGALTLDGLLDDVNAFIAAGEVTFFTSAAGDIDLSIMIDDLGLIDDENVTLVADSRADLSVTKSDSADPILGGDANLTYTLSVDNAGPLTANNLAVTDTLPSEVTFVSASGTGWACGEAAGTVTCTRASLAVGAAPPITIEVSTEYDGGSPTNQASVSADETDPAAGNNSVFENTTVVGRFTCDNQAYLLRDVPAQLTEIDPSISPFALQAIGGPTGAAIESLGFRRTDGVLYGFRNGPFEVVQVDANAGIVALGLPAGLPAAPLNAGDVSDDGSTLFLNADGSGTLYRVALPALTVTSVAITGDSGGVEDWAFHPGDGLLYGGDSGHSELAVLDPTTGVRTDVALPTLSGGGEFVAAWFDGKGRLFLHNEAGTIFEVDPTGPTIVGTHLGVATAAGDGAACRQAVLGVAKRMRKTEAGLPAEIRLDFVFENLSGTVDLSALSAQDDLADLFRIHGADWTFTSITSTPLGFANPSFNGHSDMELINPSPSQGLLAGTSASIQVLVELMNDTSAMGEYCGQIEGSGETATGTIFTDVSTDDGQGNPIPPESDPNGDGLPIEREPACFDVTDVPVELLGFVIE